MPRARRVRTVEHLDGINPPPLEEGRATCATLFTLLLLRWSRRLGSGRLGYGRDRRVLLFAQLLERSRQHQRPALERRWPDATVNRTDGLRLDWPDRWLHVRGSNTEPVVRIIAEAPTKAEARETINEVRSFV